MTGNSQKAQQIIFLYEILQNLHESYFSNDDKSKIFIQDKNCLFIIKIHKCGFYFFKTDSLKCDALLF